MTFPESGGSRLSITFPVVVLPQPLSPTSPMFSPFRMVSVTSSTACTSPTFFFRRMPLVKTGKYFFRFLISMRVSAN